jgi:hypothetical protein
VAQYTGSTWRQAELCPGWKQAASNRVSVLINSAMASTCPKWNKVSRFSNYPSNGLHTQCPAWIKSKGTLPWALYEYVNAEYCYSLRRTYHIGLKKLLYASDYLFLDTKQIGYKGFRNIYNKIQQMYQWHMLISKALKKLKKSPKRVLTTKRWRNVELN